MKHYIKTTLYLIAFTTLFLSCSDQLDRTPIDELEESTAYNTVSDLGAGLAGAIGGININATIRFNSIFTDNGKLGLDNGGQRLPLLNQLIDPNGGDEGLWTSHYRTINNFNRVIAASENITVGAADLNEFNNILAQCYAFRAYLHSELFVYYSLNMNDATAGSIPYQNTVATSGSLGRLSTEDFMTQINADLDMANSLFPSSADDINFATKDFGTFIKARLALYTGDYNTAITNATSLINKYALADTSEYTQMFNEQNTNEVIFKYDNVQGSNNSIAGNWIFTGSGNAFVEMSNSLYNSYDADDVRLSVVLNPNSDPAGNIHNIAKYPVFEPTINVNDFKAMRISEMYLVRAEANARNSTSNLAAAAADVQAIRVARYTANTPTLVSYPNLIAAITDIKLERRRELAYEGHRYVDIKRYKDILNIGIVRDALDCLGSFPCELEVSSPKFIFPIPQSEIAANPELSASQAPGY